MQYCCFIHNDICPYMGTFSILLCCILCQTMELLVRLTPNFSVAKSFPLSIALPVVWRTISRQNSPWHSGDKINVLLHGFDQKPLLLNNVIIYYGICLYLHKVQTGLFKKLQGRRHPLGLGGLCALSSVVWFLHYWCKLLLLTMDMYHFSQYSAFFRSG